jgi:Arc/MetJ family transcription regulator
MKIKIEKALIANAREVSGIKSKKEVVEKALQLYIRLSSQESLIQKDYCNSSK